MADKIKVESVIMADLQTIWGCWTQPTHIINWNFASEDWHCPHAVSELKNGGTFSYRMAARDGSAAFDFSGKFLQVLPLERLEILLDDGRELRIEFLTEPGGIRVVEEFDAERINPKSLQQQGWQAILDRFKSYVEQLK